MIDVEVLYSQQLTEADRRLLRTVAGERVPVSTALSSPETEQAVFGTARPGGHQVAEGGPAAPDTEPGITVAPLEAGLSPFLVFATAVHRTAASLQTATFVEERWAPRVRIPLFDVAALRELVSDPARTYFLVELLTSYTHVASGVTWTKTPRGWRRRRFSELDPARLAGLLEVVPPAERPGVYRRLGDLALFLVGVFPDHPPALGHDASTDRLLRLSGIPGEQADLGPRALLELLGARWYGAAVASARRVGSPVTTSLEVVGHIASHFDQARRVLNAVTDRYLFPWRDQWFATGR